MPERGRSWGPGGNADPDRPQASKYVIDGVFFQFSRTGIARVWECVLAEWATSGFAREVTVLDRAGTAPRLPGIHYRMVAPYFHSVADLDRQLLQQVCDRLEAQLFLSTYYTTPLTIPSVFLCHDMIPEVMEMNLNNPDWQDKHRAIRQSVAHVAVSQNTARDLAKFFPNIPLSSIALAYNGISQAFTPASPGQIEQLKFRYGITRPYFLLVGPGGGDYKNAQLFFSAFEHLENQVGFEIVCTGPKKVLEKQFGTRTPGGARIHAMQFDDDELPAVYSGAVALVYPSKYEGFGLPVLEAMACGCPVITCPCASLPEVAGEAALYVDPEDALQLAQALVNVQQPHIRECLIVAGLERVRHFSWTRTALALQDVLTRTAGERATRSRQAPLAALIGGAPPIPPNQLPQVLRQARQLYEMGNLNGATALYYQILQHTPETVGAIYGLALVFRQLGGRDSARQMLVHVSQRRPDFAEVHCQLGRMSEEDDLLEAASAYYRTALKLDPRLGQARDGLERTSVSGS